MNEKDIIDVEEFIKYLKDKGYDNKKIFEAVLVKYSGIFKDESI